MTPGEHALMLEEDLCRSTGCKECRLAAAAMLRELADEVERLREALANVLFDPRKFRAAAHAILASAGSPQVATTGDLPTCICGEINARHCPVHNEPEPGSGCTCTYNYRDPDCPECGI